MPAAETSRPAGAATRPFEGHRPGSAGYRRLSLALFAAGLATFAALYSTQPVLPDLARDFALSPAASALSVSAATLGLGVALLVVGPVTERHGRTPLMHSSLVAASVVGVLCALAPSWPTLLALRVLQGVTLAGLSAVAMAYLREEVHPEAHGRASGLYIGGTALGGMVGRLLASGVGDLAGWRWALGAIAAFGVVCTVVVRLLLPASQGFVPAPAGRRHAWASTRRVLGDPALLLLYAFAALAMGGFVATYNALGFRLAAPPYRLSLGVAGLVFLCYALGSVSSTVAGGLADRLGRRAVMPFGIVLATGGLVLTLAGPLWLVVPGVALETVGFFAAHGVASGWVSARAHLGGGGTGQASSLYLFAYYLGSSVFGAVSGLAWSGGGWDLVVLVVGGLFVLALGCALALRRVPSLLERRGDEEPPGQ
ncbi:MAG: MFS transporter [Actinomycetota bacterium]|nr:MFS transporter [Actinomycetota bacterium]